MNEIFIITTPSQLNINLFSISIEVITGKLDHTYFSLTLRKFSNIRRR